MGSRARVINADNFAKHPRTVEKRRESVENARWQISYGFSFGVLFESDTLFASKHYLCERTQAVV